MHGKWDDLIVRLNGVGGCGRAGDEPEVVVVGASGEDQSDLGGGKECVGGVEHGRVVKHGRVGGGGAGDGEGPLDDHYSVDPDVPSGDGG